MPGIQTCRFHAPFQIERNIEDCQQTILVAGQRAILTCKKTLIRSSGAVAVRETTPARPPATKCLHHIPETIS